MNLTYNLSQDISLLIRHGDDLTFETRTERFPFGGASGNASFSEQRRTVREANTDFLVSYNKTIDNSWSMDVSVGGNRRNSTYESLNGGSGQLLVPGLYTLNNSAIATSSSEFASKKRVYSLYAIANVNYKDMVYLALTGRNDWSSTLPKQNNSYFYPSATLSVVMSEILDFPKQISFVKFRSGFAQVGKDASPYSLENVLSNDGQYNGSLGFAQPATLANPDLKPEISTSLEFGLESKLLDNRIGLEVTYYTQDTKNQVIPITLPQSSGYTGRLSNAGKIQNSGIEITLDASPIRKSNFNWDVTANFSANKSKVIELAEGLEQFSLGGFGDNGEQLIARIGGPVFGIYGFKQATVDDASSPFFGEKIYSSAGTPVRRNDPEELGKANPDYIIGLNNKVSYKNFSFSFLFDIRHGGILYSAATNIMYGGGYNQQTADWRNNGVGGEGVLDNNDGSYSPNNIVLSGNDIKSIWSSPWRKVSTNNFYSASYIKLREMNITYSLSEKLTDKLPFDRASISLVGRNLLVWDKVPNQDADVYFEGIPGYTGGYTYPTSRTYGVTMNFSF